MTTANKLLDMYAEVCKVTQDKDIATRLRVTKSAVSNWRHGRAKPNAAAVDAMCRATGENPIKWLHMIEADRARTPADRMVWLRLAQGTAALALSALLYSLGHLDGQTLALALSAPIYIMRSLGVLLILALAGYAASKTKGMKQHAWVLERM